MAKSNTKEAPSGLPTVEVKEKWYMMIKKQPFICGILFNLLIVILLFCLAMGIMVLFSDHKVVSDDNDADRYTSIVMGTISLVLLFLLLFFLYRPLFNRRRYEVAAEGNKLIIRRNGKEVFNVLGSKLSFVCFSERPILGVDSLKIDYVDEYERTRFYYIPLRFIPNDECQELTRYLFSFCNQYATNRKSAEEADWSKMFPMAIFFTVLFGGLYIIQLFSDEKHNMAISFIALFSIVFFVYIGFKYFNQRRKKK